MRIACALVTYNRVRLLAKAVEAVLAQTRPLDRVFVIDNASTDGTREFLESQSDTRLTAIHTSQNLGGAGGFRLAVDLAIANGYDAVWLFDDDGLPGPHSLETLLSALENHGLAMANSLVVSEKDPTVLAFGLIKETPGYRGPSISTVAEAKAEASGGLLFDMANPFNGTLLRCSTVGAAGSIRNEMFIWGDEIEFMRRLIRQGHRVATVLEARHQHPEPKTTTVQTRFGATRVPSKGREIYFYRNRAFNAYQHFGLNLCLREMARTVLRNLARGATGEALMTVVWGLDGVFDLYALKPSRGALNAAWRTEFDSALAQSRMQQGSVR
jgi:rhamnopyranosyl-N-acetylglucosaminyl-diphospho-decaprenol beta-1,3/1,4-galactofuranosyltransferase